MQASDRDKPSAGHVTASCTQTSQPVVRRPSQPLQRGQDEADRRTPAGSQAAHTRGHTRVSTHATHHVQYPSPQMHLHKPRSRRFPRGVQASGPGNQVRLSDQERGPGPRPPAFQPPFCSDDLGDPPANALEQRPVGAGGVRAPARPSQLRGGAAEERERGAGLGAECWSQGHDQASAASPARLLHAKGRQSHHRPPLAVVTPPGDSLCNVVCKALFSSARAAEVPLLLETLDYFP